jgi:alanine racemase
MLIPHHFQNWIELDFGALKQNIAQFKSWLPAQTGIAAVVKSNAYGHGLVEIGQLLERSDGIAALCVINVSEAIQLRKADITKRIWVIGYLDQPYEAIVEHRLEVIVYDYATVNQLNQTGAQLHCKIKVHVKFDTGMNRLGTKPEELDLFILYIQKLPWIEITAIFTHFAQSYNESVTHEQEEILQQAFSYGYPVHGSNSHGLLSAKYTYDFARVGIGLYGYLARAPQTMQEQLKPILSLKTKILQIKKINTGDFVGYERLFQAPDPMTIAILAIGYYEGVDPLLAAQGQVLIAGRFARIIGRICMNLMIVDISEIPDCIAGQEVTILGKEGNRQISVHDWSRISHLSIYAHLIKLAPNSPKIIIP